MNERNGAGADATVGALALVVGKKQYPTLCPLSVVPKI